MKKLFIVLMILCTVAVKENYTFAQKLQSPGKLLINKDISTIISKNKVIDFAFDDLFQITNPTSNPNVKLKSATVEMYDSIYYWKWDTLTANWDLNPYEKTISFEYNASGNELSETTQTFNTRSAKWENYQNMIYAYDSKNNPTGYVTMSWDTISGIWENYNKVENIYNSNNKQTIQLVYNGDGTTWVNQTQIFYTYDSNNNLTNETIQKWNGSAWVNSYKMTSSFDGNNNMITNLYQSWNGTDWINISQATYLYNTNHQITDIIQQIWNKNGWVNCYHFTRTYDANYLEISDIQQDWEDTVWVNAYQYNYNYIDNKIQNCISNYWSGTKWVKNYVNSNTYNKNILLASSTETYWNESGTYPIEGDSIYYYIRAQSTESTGLKKQGENLTIYPNPASEKIKIISDRSAINSIEIFNISGRKYFSLSKEEWHKNNRTSSSLHEINVSGLPNGIYMIKALTDNGIMVSKFVKN
jgi:hypothetical protein